MAISLNHDDVAARWQPLFETCAERGRHSIRQRTNAAFLVVARRVPIIRWRGDCRSGLARDMPTALTLNAAPKG
jgi:hypothetical protein